MARMSIDDKFLRDPRIKRLAAKLCFTVFEARGRLLEVFAVTYDRECDVLSADDIDTAADMAGFARAMVDVDLAEETDVGMRIRGAHERIKYLEKKRDSASVGGRKSGESRRKAPRHDSERSTARSSASPRAKHAEAKPEARRNPSSSVPDSASASVPDLPPAPDPATAPAPELRIADSAKASPQPQVTAAWFEYFQDTHGGAKPTWGGRQGKQLGELIRAHGADELIRRICVLRESPPKFPPPPWDFATFVAHVDKIAAPTLRATSRSSPSQIALEELETARREDRERGLA